MYCCQFAPGTKLIFPRSKLAPHELRPERRLGEKQRYVPAQMIHGAILQIDKAVAQLTEKKGRPKSSWILLPSLIHVHIEFALHFTGLFTN
jgi:hypothetical protein